MSRELPSWVQQRLGLRRPANNLSCQGAASFQAPSIIQAQSAKNRAFEPMVPQQLRQLSLTRWVFGRRLETATPWRLSPAVILIISSTLLLAHCSLFADDKTGVGLNKISLPSGPGSIEGLGDSFEPQLNSGTSSYSVKIAAPPGVAGLQPNVVLRYNSGAGNGHFGIAWTDGSLTIQRQTQKGLPTYGGSDLFTLGGEEMVPLSDGSYRVKNESEFRRVIRSGTGWVMTDRKGTRYLLGCSNMSANPSRLVRPTGETFDDTFAWHVDSVTDVNGNQMQYFYQQFSDSPGDTYCTEIRYSIFGANYHSIVFDYELRPDGFSSCLSGFEVHTGRRCYQVRVLSRGGLVRRYGLGYTLPADDPVEPVTLNDVGQQFSLLRQVTQFDSSAGSSNYLPPLRLGYTRFDAGQVQSGTFINPTPHSLGNANVTLADINCDGLPDFFVTDPLTNEHVVYYNHGLGRFSARTVFASYPNTVRLDSPTVQLADLDGDGRIDLIQKAGPSNGIFSFFPNSTLPRLNDDTHPSWGAEHSYGQPYPSFDLNDPNVRSLDLNGDKKMDYMRTTAAGFVYYYNRGNTWEEDGIYLFGEPQMGDITYADALTFDDSSHVKLADMNGDRLLDLVRINLFQTQLEVAFWPNKGRGYWGSRQQMSGAIDIGTVPIEDVFLLDVNGDGLADVVAVAYDKVSFWINLGNNTFSRRFEVANTPAYIKGQTVLRQADINGNGSTDLLWENWDPSIGAYRISWVDFIGTSKPNLLAVIDNGIGLRTEISYKTSTSDYIAAIRGSNPWTTRLPFPSWCVSKIVKRFGLDLDAIAGEDKYITEFGYHDGYYDTFQKEFRGFGFAKKVERGDDRLTDGGPAPEINSPSTLTRMCFHTGVPDGVDNNGNGLVDEFDSISGYEEESLKGKVLWTEVLPLTAEFDGVDSDGDGFVDESDEGTFAGQMAPDSLVLYREINTWSIKTLHSSTGGFSEQPFSTLNGGKVSFAFLAAHDKQVIEGPSTNNSSGNFGTTASPATIHTTYDYDSFGNNTNKNEYGVTSGGSFAYNDERFTTITFAKNLTAWIIGLPSDMQVTDVSGAFVARSISLYDNQGAGSVGTRGLLTGEQHFIDVGHSVSTQTVYDTFGNPSNVRDPDYTAGSGGHERVYGFDSTFHTFVESETIRIGGGNADLSASATYDFGGGVLTSSTDFNGNTSSYQYDRFFRLVGIVKPGDFTGSPTQTFEYKPGDPWRALAYTYTAAGDLSLSVTAANPVVSSVGVHSRETAGGGTFDIYQITDGAGHKLGTIEEGENGSQWVYKNVKRYTSRGAERDSYLPFFGGSPAFVTPPPDGARTTSYYDALGRAIATVNPPETTGGSRSSTRTVYRPLKMVLFDEEDNDPASAHYNTPHVQYQDGLGRLIGVDEISSGQTWPTRYAYDLNDQLTRINDSQSNVKTMAYDGLKRLSSMNDPDRGVMTYAYDDASNLTQTVDAKGQTIQMTYDGANRIKTEDYLDSAGRSPDVTYSYDASASVAAGDGSTAAAANVKGKLASVTDLSGEERLSYDARGRTAWKIKRIPDPLNGQLVSYQSSFSYDSLDRLTTMTYPDGDSVGYTYNSRSLPQTITGGPGGFIVSGMSYLASGQLSTTTYGNSVSTSYAYDPRLRLNALTTQNATTQLIKFGYTFDSASNITRIDDNRSAIAANDPRKNTQVFGYDDLYRLTSVQYPATSGQIGYGYDQIGNMLGQTSNIAHDENGLSVTNLGTMSYGGTAGPSNRIGRSGGQPGPHALTAASVGGRSYPYDVNGNMQTIDGLACTWDFKDRLTAVENAQMRAEYTYDYTDRRITKKVFPKSGTGVPPVIPQSTLYVDRTFELREDGAPVKYVWNGDTRVARVTTNLNATQRVQRFRLQPGWNVCALAVTLTDGSMQLAVSPVQQVYRYDAATRTYSLIATNDTLPPGTLLRVRASAAGELAVRGACSASSPVTYPAGRAWIANATFQPLDVAARLPADAPLWFFDAATQDWRHRFLAPLASAGNHPSRLAPGEATFAATTAPFTLSAPDSTLEIRYYHQDHLGSSSVMSDANGQLVSESAYYPFGHPRQENQPRGVKESYQFTQKERDGESGLGYFEARFVESGLSRFTRPDPITDKPPTSWCVEPQRWNAYSYATNRPLNLTDPSGCDSEAPTQSFHPDAPALCANISGGLAAGAMTGGSGLGGAVGAGVSLCVNTEGDIFTKAQYSTPQDSQSAFGYGASAGGSLSWESSSGKPGTTTESGSAFSAGYAGGSLGVGLDSKGSVSSVSLGIDIPRSVGSPILLTKSETTTLVTVISLGAPGLKEPAPQPGPAPSAAVSNMSPTAAPAGNPQVPIPRPN